MIHNEDKPLLVVLDTNVIVHMLSREWESFSSNISNGAFERVLLRDAERKGIVITDELKLQLIDNLRHGWLARQLRYVEGLTWLGHLTRPVMNVVWAMDCLNKDYWRKSWLEGVSTVLGKPLLYKGGRRKLSADHDSLKSDLLATVSSPLLMYKGYEADDVIAGLVQLNNNALEPCDILVATVDSDLLGLVGENTGWLCLCGYKPRLRLDLQTINHWRASVKKLPELVSPSQLWWYKAVVEGDKSDNMPPVANGMTLPAIDLLQPPEQYRLWTQPLFQEDCKEILRVQPMDLQQRYNGMTAKEEMRRQGCLPVIDPIRK